MTSTIDTLITQIENETGISANTKTRIGTVLRAISNERPFTVFTGLLSQPAAATPTVQVLQNNTGRTFTLSKTDTGVFFATSNVAFDMAKVVVFIGNTNAAYNYATKATSTTEILINVADPGSGAVDGALDKTPFEIRIYN